MIAFIFDIDGTIIDSMPWHGRSWEAFLNRHGLPYGGEAFLRRTAGRTAVELMREIFGPLDDARAQTLAREKEAIYRELFAPVFREVRGFRAFAAAARAAGIRIACATAGDADNLGFALRGLDMENAFDAVVGAHDVARGKPEPDLFLLAAQRIGVAAGDCVVFEDAANGIEAARRAGMPAIALTTGAPADDLAAAHVLAAIPDYRDVAPGDIVALVRRRARLAAD
jgi:beta-phosphoglucomutase-like phosphatase (HAD superfamily)